MKSIFAKILVWFFATLIVCLAGSKLTKEFRAQYAPGNPDFFSRSLGFEVNGATDAYERGGKPALELYLADLEKYFPGRYVLVNQRGADVITGRDERQELQRVSTRRWTYSKDGRVIMSWPSRDVKYRLLIDAVLPPAPSSLVPYYIWIILATTIFCYVLAVHLASPLRSLEQTVERFGRGDLSIRARDTRSDEVGELARAFNVMAGRIEALLASERRLLQDISHELRSPLARLEFAIELARKNPDPNTSLDRIKKEVDRLSTLVAELLEATRAEGDPEARRVDEIALHELIDQIVEDSTVESQARKIQLRVLQNEAVTIHGDGELLRRAIENVLRNAIRYTPERSSIEVRLTRRSENAVVGIRDYGPGVPEHTLSSLFKPFFRVESDRNRRKGGGVGLGLAITRRAVALHHGTVRARNMRPGLLIEIELPCVPLPAPVPV